MVPEKLKKSQIARSMIAFSSSLSGASLGSGSFSGSWQFDRLGVGIVGARSIEGPSIGKLRKFK